MTNIISELQESNKKLIEENENLKRQLANKEENLKVKIGHVTGQSLDDKGEVGMYAPTGTRGYKKLNKKGMDEDKLRMAVDPNETREGTKNCKRIGFDNITIEEMLEDFIDSSNELSSEGLDYVGRGSRTNSKLYEQKRKFERELEELEKSKDQQIKELEEEIKELEESLELEEIISECHLEALEVARQWRVEQSKEKMTT